MESVVVALEVGVKNTTRHDTTREEWIFFVFTVVWRHKNKNKQQDPIGRHSSPH